MGKEVFTGRYTCENEKDIVVFIIGMRINKIWAIHKWLPVLKAMPPMIRELYTNKDLGFLAAENFGSPRRTLMVQYWRSSEDLMSYAKGAKHLKAWKEFNRKVGNNDAVGIYHETYILPAKNYESVYGNMPHFGLALATGHKAIDHTINSARKRLGN
ncbi:DUF4188 domain-containing protein [Ornithinibacillus sp. L9]|uniref:DUF4188 domain-containing protein n=1 Tax=Ornithinibacillus caprae TaxID=2678566 RepID=A0A6N8FLH9_9BACI|nr:DUF4188 domain-containing protein [Ornithinibacillus caprae]MUK89224.1 DUF4188 domain-containing protein [Ornithinibacillus caprae]